MYAALTGAAVAAVAAAAAVTGDTDFDLLVLTVWLGSRMNRSSHTIKNREIEQFRNGERRDGDRLLLIIEQIQ